MLCSLSEDAKVKKVKKECKSTFFLKTKVVEEV